jgi:hypothetical protein
MWRRFETPELQQDAFMSEGGVGERSLGCQGKQLLF